MQDEIGIETGELCNRKGCLGIIQETENERGCSCHINPPCSGCTTDRHYCPVCEWAAIDEIDEMSPIKPNYKKTYKVRTLADLDKTKISWIIKGRTHFSQICEGVYPPNTTPAEVREKVKGTFGGMFEHFKDGYFKFIAYTD